MSVPEELVWLIAQLRGTASRRERIRLLARGWRTLRDLSPADRIAVAHELGFDGAESLVEQLSRRGGTSPAAVLELLERAEDAGPEQIVTMVQDLADPDGRRSLGERFLNAAKHWVADLESSEDPTEPTVDVDKTAVVVPPDGSQDIGGADTDVPVPPPSLVAPTTEPGPDDGPVAVAPAENAERFHGEDPTEASPESEPDLVTDDEGAAEADSETVADGPERRVADRIDKTTVAEPDSEPVAEPPVDSPHARSGVAVVAPVMAVSEVVRRLDRCPSVLRRLKELSGLARHLTDADPDDYSSVLELFPDGWARRRALEAMFRVGAPRSFEDAMSLAAALEDRAQRTWALSTLMANRDLTPRDVNELMSLPLSPVLRRRLARLGTESQKSMR